MCFDACLCRSCEQTERCCCPRTTSSQHDRIELCRHIEKRKKQNKKKIKKQNKKRNQLTYILHIIKTNLQINMIKRILLIFLTILRNVEKKQFDSLNFFHLY